MKKRLVVLATGMLFAATAATAASPQHYGHDSHRGQSQDRHDGQDNRHDRDNRGNHYYVMHDRGRHEGWYRRGGRVPVEYRGSRYVVTDWRVHHLRQPPRGYHWVRSDNNDYLLVAITTGVIASIFASH